MLGTKELLKLVKEIKLVENLDERELTNPEGSGFDVRTAEFFKLENEEGYLGVKERHTPNVISAAKHGVDKEITIKPGEFYLVKTMERVNLPKDINVIIRPRSTLQRCGVMLSSGSVGPGYCGEFNFGIYNAGKNDFKIELGARFAHLYFFRTGENHANYRGQWLGGRVSTDGKKEIQV